MLCAQRAQAEGVPPADTLLPKTTVGFLSVTNYDDLSKQWKKTPLGKVLGDPVLEPFETDLKEQLRTKSAGVADRLGIHLDDLDGVPSGEAALALIQPKVGEAAVAMVIDVSGRIAKAQQVLAMARANLLNRGATESRAAVGEATLLVFDLPPPPAPPPTAKRPAGAPPEPPPASQQTVYFLAKNVLAAADNLAVARGILNRLLRDAHTDSLAQVPAYQKTMQRCAADAGSAVPQVRWFAYPLGWVEAAWAATPPAERQRRREMMEVLDIMRNQGFAAILGAGGFVDVAADGYQILCRTSIYAPRPYVRAMRMFVLPNQATNAFLPETWVPADLATYTTLYLSPLDAFDNFGYLYDAVVGEPGVWEQTLRGLIEDVNGPRLDLRNELVANLGQRVTVLGDYKRPITPQSERLLVAVEIKGLKEAQAVTKAVEKFFKDDPGAKRRVIAGRVIWEIIDEEQAGAPALKVEIPSLAPKKGPAKSKEEEDDEAGKSHLLPHGAVTVAEGHLLIATHIDFLRKILKPLPPAQMLRNNPEFLQVWKTSETRFVMSEQCGREFWWTDEKVRPTYELVREGKMPESDSILARVLNSASGAAQSGTPREQKIKGGKLPDFDVVARALGPVTAAAVSEPSGWFFKGVLLPKPAAATASEKPAAKPSGSAQD
jgi:hypothetical protein